MLYSLAQIDLLVADDVELGLCHASLSSWSRQSNDKLLLSYRWALNFNLFSHVLLRAINTVDYNCQHIFHKIGHVDCLALIE